MLKTFNSSGAHDPLTPPVLHGAGGFFFGEPCVSFIFSQALVEASSLANSWGTDVSVPSSANPTPKPCLWHDKTMAPSRLSRFGMTCKTLTDDRGAALLTWWLEDSRARTSALPETVPELTANAAGCGTTWPASLAKLDHATSSWKTAQHSLLGGWVEFSQTWPRWGLMRGGECWERQTLAHRTNGSASGLRRTPSASVIDAKSNVVKLTGRTPQDPQVGLADQVMAMERAKLPTPTACGNHNRNGASGDSLATAVAMSLTMTCLESTDAQTAKARMYPTATATAYKGWSPNHNRAHTDDRLDYTIEREAHQPGQQTPPMRLNPDWVEWLMGWPIGHTDLKPLETARFREWQQQHGSC